MKHGLIGELRTDLEVWACQLRPLPQPLHAHVAGGNAMNHYTGHRMFHQADIMCYHRIAIPPDLQIFPVPDPDVVSDVRFLTMDGSFTDILGSFPRDWTQQSQKLAQIGSIILYVIDPTVMAVSKVARFQNRDRARYRDREDIRQLALCGLINPERFAARIIETLDHFVGDISYIREQAALAKVIIEETQYAGPLHA